MQARMRKLLLLPVLAVGLMSACTHSIPDNTPEYLKEASPLDPPGTEDARKALRDKVVKQGAFSPGDTPEVQQGKVYLFDRNPDYDPHASGRMLEAKKVTVRSCEGLYYFVTLEDGNNGYLRESDMLAPVTLVNNQPGVLFPGEASAEPLPMEMPVMETVALDANQKLMTNTAGRTVVVVSKKSSRSDDFEARKKAMMEAAAAEAQAQPAADPKHEPLPEPAGGGN